MSTIVWEFCEHPECSVGAVLICTGCFGTFCDKHFLTHDHRPCHPGTRDSIRLDHEQSEASDISDGD